MTLEMREMPKPDGPLTDKELRAATRTYYLENLLRQGIEPEVAERAWALAPPEVFAYWAELVRGPVNSVIAHRGRHVRACQAEVIQERGKMNSTVAALSIIISQAEDSVTAAKLVCDLLDLP